jgi:hypothetical protein
MGQLRGPGHYLDIPPPRTRLPSGPAPAGPPPRPDTDLRPDQLQLVVAPPDLLAGTGMMQLWCTSTIYRQVELSLCPVDRRSLLLGLHVKTPAPPPRRPVPSLRHCSARSRLQLERQPTRRSTIDSTNQSPSSGGNAKVSGQPGEAQLGLRGRLPPNRRTTRHAAIGHT